MNVAPDDIDVNRFDQLRQQAISVRAEDPLKARALLLEAESLWGGEPLAEMEGDWAASQRQRLIRLRRTAAVARIDIDWQVNGPTDEVIGELTELTLDGHIDEKVVGRLMAALAAAGRTEEAVATFHDVKARMLRNNVTPGPELSTAYLKIAHGNAPTTRPAAGSGPGQGPGQILNMLDPDPPHLEGRETDLAAWLAEIDTDLRSRSTPALMAIDGLPGAGKSTLALRAAHILGPRCPDGSLQVSMHTYSPPQEPVGTRVAFEILLASLGVGYGVIQRAESLDALKVLWRRHTNGRRLLLFLDDVADAEHIKPLLPTSAGSIVLITSRRRLSGLQGLRQHTLGTLAEDDVGRALTALAGRTLPDLAEGLERFAHLCGGLPLAVFVAAGLLNTHPTWTLADLNNRLAASVPGTGGDQVHAAFAASFTALPDHLRTLLCLAAAHPGPDIEPIAAAALTGVEPAAAALALEALQEHRLIQEVDTNRYRLHDLLRAFALAQIDHGQRPSNTDEALRRLVGVYAAIAVNADDAVHPYRTATIHTPAVEWAGRRTFPSADLGRAWLDAERAGLLAVHALAVERGWHDEAGSLPLILAEHLDHRGEYIAALRIVEKTRQAWSASASASGAPEPAAVLNARLLTDLAAAHARAEDDLVLALDYAEQALGAWTACGDSRGRADALVQAGRIHGKLSRPADAIAAFEEAIRLYEEAGDPARRARVQLHLSIPLFETGRPAEAMALGRTALETARAVRAPELHVDVLTNIGEMLRQAGHVEQALAYFHEGAPIAEALGDPHNIAILANNIGAAYLDLGEFGAAETSIAKALALFENQGDRRNQIDALTYLAEARHRRGDHAAALGHLHDASRLAAAVRAPIQQSRIHLATGQIHERQDHPMAALGSYRAALKRAEQAGSPQDQIYALRAVAKILRLVGDPDADRRVAQADALERGMQDPEAGPA